MLNFRDDPTAFKNFINEHQDRVYNIVLKRVQNAEDAEEITQDVFIAIFNKPEVFRGDSAITTWIYRIAINKCIDHLRKKERSWRGFLKFFNNSYEESHEPKEFLHPGIAQENKENAMILFKAIKQLSANQHTAWMLSEMDGMSYKEISEVMNVSVSSVESLLFRARQNLRKILADMYPGE
jgi:RNA polymerase sigma-70 factor (ECF subfamily)